jgi:hypothetical protein
MLFTSKLVSLIALVALVPAASGMPATFRLRRQDPNDPQVALRLDPSQVQENLKQDGQATPDPGQVPSATSSNNFINFCLTQPDVPLTNGQQIIGGSCNPTPMGRIPAKDKMPSSKFTFPDNKGKVKAGQDFTVKMAIVNLDTGFFTDPLTTYYAAPQTLNDQGVITGHSHVVIQPIPSFDSPEPLDPTAFDFFKGLNEKANNGELSATVPGLKPGFYRMASINTGANHAPAIGPVAQRGSFDDYIYFEAEA